MGLIVRTIQSFLSGKIGSVLNVALYIAISGAVTALADYFGKLDVTNEPLYFATLMGIINLILVAIKQKMK